MTPPLRLLPVLLGALIAVGLLLFLRARRVVTPDERFWLHRYKSLSYAAMAGLLATGFFLFRGYLRGEGLRPDLLLILLAMAAAKFTALAWFRLKD